MTQAATPEKVQLTQVEFASDRMKGRLNIPGIRGPWEYNQPRQLTPEQVEIVRGCYSKLSAGFQRDVDLLIARKPQAANAEVATEAVVNKRAITTQVKKHRGKPMDDDLAQQIASSAAMLEENYKGHATLFYKALAEDAGVEPGVREYAASLLEG